jgi:hypothetical protein
LIDPPKKQQEPVPWTGGNPLKSGTRDRLWNSSGFIEASPPKLVFIFLRTGGTSHIPLITEIHPFVFFLPEIERHPQIHLNAAKTTSLCACRVLCGEKNSSRQGAKSAKGPMK